MITIKGTDTVHTLLKMYATVNAGNPMHARGQKCRNVHNMAVVMPGNDMPIITNFKARGLNLEYAKKEWLWYIGADPKDDSIEKHASMWKKLKQPDGSYFSNYGQYIFGGEGVSQFDYVVQTLIDDPNSRRASMSLLRREHLFPENTDTVCTYAINFTIEEGQLLMTVMMRSNDVIFGFTNDAFCFSQLFLFMHAMLQERMPSLKIGTYTHITNSMHVYERHFDMIYNIVAQATNGYTRLDVPTPTVGEVRQLIASRGKEGSGDYATWLQA